MCISSWAAHMAVQKTVNHHVDVENEIQVP